MTTPLSALAIMQSGEVTRKMGSGALFNWMMEVSQLAVTMVDVNTNLNVDITGANDVSTAVQALYNSLKGTGKTLFFGPGTYKFNVGLNMGTGNAVPIVLSPGTTLVANLNTGVNSPLGVLFFCPVSLGAATTLSAAASLGDETLSFTAIPAGMVIGSNFIVLSTDGASGAQYTAINIVGTTVTTDRAVLRTFPNGSAVTLLTGRTENFSLHGNGAVITGNCFRYGELPDVWRAIVDNVQFNDSQGYAAVGAWSFDTGTYSAEMTRCKFNGPSGVAFESNEASEVRESTADAHGTIPANSAGFYMSDCSACRIVRCFATRWHGAGSGSGAIFTTQGVLGCLDCEIIGGSFQGDNGITIAGTRIAITDASTPRCSPGAGLLISSSTGVTVTSLAAPSCASGISVQTTTGLIVNGVDVTGAVNIGIDCNSNTQINGLRHMSGFAGGVVRATSCEVTVTDYEVTLSGTTAGTPFAFIAGATSLLRVSHGLVHLNTATGAGQVAFGTSSATGKLVLDDASVDGSGTPGGLFVFSTAANSPVRHKRLRWPAAGFTTTIAGQSNRGAVALVTGTKVIAFTDLQPDDFVNMQLKTVGGTTGFPSVAMTPGTGFTLNSTNAADTGTYEYEVTG
jgi:hypothetical protein